MKKCLEEAKEEQKNKVKELSGFKIEVQMIKKESAEALKAKDDEIKRLSCALNQLQIKYDDKFSTYDEIVTQREKLAIDLPRAIAENEEQFIKICALQD